MNEHDEQPEMTEELISRVIGAAEKSFAHGHGPHGATHNPIPYGQHSRRSTAEDFSKQAGTGNDLAGEMRELTAQVRSLRQALEMTFDLGPGTVRDKVESGPGGEESERGKAHREEGHWEKVDLINAAAEDLRLRAGQEATSEGARWKAAIMRSDGGDAHRSKLEAGSRQWGGSVTDATRSGGPAARDHASGGGWDSTCLELLRQDMNRNHSEAINATTRKDFTRR